MVIAQSIPSHRARAKRRYCTERAPRWREKSVDGSPSWRASVQNRASSWEPLFIRGPRGRTARCGPSGTVPGIGAQSTRRRSPVSGGTPVDWSLGEALRFGVEALAQFRVRRSRRAGGPRPHRGGAGGRSRQRDAGAADGRRERTERPAGGEPRPTRHGGDPRQRDDDPRRGGVRRAGGLRRKSRHYRCGGRKRPKAPSAACRRVGESGSDGALSRPGAQQRQGC